MLWVVIIQPVHISLEKNTCDAFGNYAATLAYEAVFVAWALWVTLQTTDDDTLPLNLFCEHAVVAFGGSLAAWVAQLASMRVAGRATASACAWFYVLTGIVAALPVGVLIWRFCRQRKQGRGVTNEANTSAAAML